MKSKNISRIRELEKKYLLMGQQPEYAIIIYDSSLTEFDPLSINVKASVVVYLPDNGREEILGNKCFKIII